MRAPRRYDFPGSTSTIDLHALTGWVPEEFRLQNDAEFNAERTWQRMLSAHRFGDCLITISSKAMSKAEEERSGLVRTHAYAVLDVRFECGLRMLQLKNPWAHKRWKGKFSAHDTKSWSPALARVLRYDQARARRVDDGQFWLDWSTACAMFETLHLNWNPELFAHRRMLHDAWPLRAPGPRNDRFSLSHNKQYRVVVNVARSAPNAVVWVLLTRHVQRVRFDESRSYAKATDNPDLDFLAVHVYARVTRAEKAFARVHQNSAADALVRGTYSNAPHNLTKLTVPAGQHEYTLVVSQYERRRDINFSLAVYSMAPFKVGRIPETIGHELRAVGEWRAESAGGCSNHGTFYTNPQWVLTLHRPLPKLLLLLEAPKECSSNVQLIQGGGRWDGSGDARAEVLTSGLYTTGVSVASFPAAARGAGPGARGVLPAGEYTVVCSTFKARQLGRFLLRVQSEDASCVSLRAIPAEGHGMGCKQHHGSWSGATAVGCANHGRYDANPRIRFRVRFAARIMVRLASDEASSASRCSLNASLFCDDGNASSRGITVERAVATSNGGVYTNTKGGVTIPLTRVSPGSYFVVPSTFDPRHSGYQLTIYCDPAGALV